jgi:hypothetical protein
MWINEIQNDLATNLPIDHYRFMLKKSIPVEQSLVSLKIDKPGAPSAIAAGEPLTLEYNDSTKLDYTYDSTQIEPLESSFDLLKLGVQGDEGIMAKWSTQLTGDRAIGIAGFTAFNGAAISNGKLNLSNGSNAYARNSDGNNYAQNGQGCFRMKMTPGWTGNPGANQHFFDLSNNVNVFNSINLYYDPSGNWALIIASDSGTLASVVLNDPGRFTAGVECEIELNVDVVNGLHELYVDGELIFSDTSTGTYTPVLPLIGMRIGDSLIGLDAVTDYETRDFQYFSQPQHTAEFTDEIPRTVSTYSTQNPTVIDAGNTIQEFAAFEANTVEPANTAIKYIMVVNGVSKYHDGSNWVESTLVTQNNTVAEVNDNANDLFDEISELKIKAVFENSSEESTPSLISVTIYDAGFLSQTSQYKISLTFLIYDDDQDKYMESEQGDETIAIETDEDNAAIALTNIPVYEGDESVSPNIIHRRIYVSTKAEDESEFGEPFFYADIEDNTTTEATILSEPTSTVTPPSDSQLDDISADHLFFNSGNRYLVQETMNRLRRYDPDGSESNTPSYFARYGQDRIEVFPKLSSDSNEAQRTLSYYAYRVPHEIFYDIERAIDLPVQARKALIQGVVWKAYAFRDRSGWDTQMNNYEAFKAELIKKLKRQTGVPSYVRDVQGDTFGREV